LGGFLFSLSFSNWPGPKLPFDSALAGRKSKRTRRRPLPVKRGLSEKFLYTYISILVYLKYIIIPFALLGRAGNIVLKNIPRIVPYSNNRSIDK